MCDKYLEAANKFKLTKQGIIVAEYLKVGSLYLQQIYF